MCLETRLELFPWEQQLPVCSGTSSFQRDEGMGAWEFLETMGRWESCSEGLLCSRSTGGERG